MEGSDLDCILQSLTLLFLPSIRLRSHNATTPVTPMLLILVKITLLDSLDNLGELRLVL